MQQYSWDHVEDLETVEFCSTDFKVCEYLILADFEANNLQSIVAKRFHAND